MKKLVLNRTAAQRARSERSSRSQSKPSIRAVSISKPVAPQGTFIVLNRRYTPPGAPASESGPAAIIQTKRSTCAAAGMVARYYLRGWDFTRWTGVRKGDRHSVVVLSPWVPDSKFIRLFLEVEIDWREWHGAALPKTDADVILVWLPRRALPGLTEREIAQRLLAEAFGGGAIYSVYGFEGEPKAEEVAHV